MGHDLKTLAKRIGKLSEGQLALLNSVVDTFEQPISSTRLESSDVVCQNFLAAFGDMLKLHHTLSDDYLDKHRFEAVMERVYRALGRDVGRPGMCNPGHDLTVDGIAWSLKTQGDKSIKPDLLHISEFMELGKGKWKLAKDLPRLRNMFLEHMMSYRRIFQLRYFAFEPTSEAQAAHFYELVEIPKTLLEESQHGEFAMMHKSKQNPKPGYCTVIGDDGQVKFRLYFDGGTERKLQIKNLRKDLCIVHANWQF